MSKWYLHFMILTGLKQTKPKTETNHRDMVCPIIYLHQWARQGVIFYVHQISKSLCLEFKELNVFQRAKRPAWSCCYTEAQTDRDDTQGRRGIPADEERNRACRAGTVWTNTGEICHCGSVYSKLQVIKFLQIIFHIQAFFCEMCSYISWVLLWLQGMFYTMLKFMFSRFNFKLLHDKVQSYSFVEVVIDWKL